MHPPPWELSRVSAGWMRKGGDGMPRKTEIIFPLFEEVRRIAAPMTDENFGKAIRYALSRYFDGEEPEETDCAISVVANMMLEQAARYDCYREQQRQNRMKKGNQEQPNATEENQGTPKSTKSSEKEPSASPYPYPYPNNTCAKAVQLLNDLSGSSFRATTKSTQKLIAAREKDGYTLADIEAVIRHQCGLWAKDANMSKYLRPETIFGNKFEGYLSDAKRNGLATEQGYTLASLEDPWEVAMRGADGHV